MPIQAECPLCGHKFTVSDQLDGKQVKCSECCNLFVASGPAVSAGAGSSGAKPGAVKGPTAGTAPGAKKINAPRQPKNAATMPAISLPDRPPSPPLQKGGIGGYSPTHKKIPTGGTASGQQKIKKGGATLPGTVKNPMAGSAAGQKKIAPKPASHHGTKKPAHAKKHGRKSSGDPFSSFHYDDESGKETQRRKRRGKSVGNFVAFSCLFLFLAVVGGGVAYAIYHFNHGGDGSNLFSHAMSDLKSLFQAAPKSTEVATSTEKTDIAKVADTKAAKTEPDPPKVVDASKEPAVIQEGKTNAQVKVVGLAYKDAQKQLLLSLEVENKGQEPVSFQGWGAAEEFNKPHPPKLTDSSGTAIERVAIPGGVEGMALSEVVPPGKSIRDLIVFPTPSAGTTSVTVELSAENIDTALKDKKITLLIPTAMLAASGLPMPKPPEPKVELKPEPEVPLKEPAVVGIILKPQLKGKGPDRQNAVNTLALLGPAAAGTTSDLIPLLKDGSESLRAAAAEALGSFGPKAKAAIPALIERLKTDEFPNVRAEAAAALGQMGPEAAKEVLPALNDALKNEKEDQPKKAIEDAIKRFDPKPAEKEKEMEKGKEKEKAKEPEKEKDKAKP